MGILSGSGKDANEICKALNLPPRTIAFSLRIRVGEPAVVEAESYVDASISANLVTVLKRYELQEIEGPNT